MNLAKVGSLSNTSAVENEWKMGQKVKHEKFGFGTALMLKAPITILASRLPSKRKALMLIAHLAKLEKVR